MEDERNRKKKPKGNSHRIFPDINEVVKEENTNLELIEKKRELRKLLKENSVIQYAPETRASLRPVYNPMAVTSKKRDNAKQFYWKKFSGGIGTKD